jgi:uncharacterized membrane protein
MTFESRHISVSINLPADEVYEFASNPENLPKWAAGLSGSIKNVNGDWIADPRWAKSQLSSPAK